YSNPRRYSYRLGNGIATHTPDQYLNAKGRVANDKDLHDRFSVDVLTDEFYGEISDWYAWAISQISFPNDIKSKKKDTTLNNEGIIRLITRLIFVWFLKQLHLIPEEFFDVQFLSDKLLKDFGDNSQNVFNNKSNLTTIYYKAVLQNLFFAMLNCPIKTGVDKGISGRRFREQIDDLDDSRLMCYKDQFQDPELFIELANKTVPFLNGGLFDCLDDSENGVYYDGFSELPMIQAGLCFPDYLFFGNNNGEKVNLSEFYGDNKKNKVAVSGIIDILKRYNFTVEENTPYDKEVSLDPELLGKVFENLLAVYNPETKAFARKATGSFYTPREIVQYMIDECLIAHLKRTVDKSLEEEYRKLLAYEEQSWSLTKSQKQAIMESLYNCKILDPACGSGAFPMGILQQMVHVLNQIDPDNEMWNKLMVSKATDETSEAFRASTKEEREEILADISRSFDQSINHPDYARKLYLIENCIYGIDIQPIAIQISKLRFFISLVIDQKTNHDPADNFGIRPLPNLELKFVAANSLISKSQNSESRLENLNIDGIKKQLVDVRHKYFLANSSSYKNNLREQDQYLRKELAILLVGDDIFIPEDARQLAEWDPYNQNSVSHFFNQEWMFGISDGFDIVIGNPPYISTKGITSNDKTLYEQEFGFSDDTYNLFTFKGLSLTKREGILSYIIPKTFWTTQTKRKMRDLILENTLIYVFDTADPFKAPMVDTCIIQVQNSPYSADHLIRFLDGSKDLSHPVEYSPIKQFVYVNAQNAVIFKPTELNLRIYDLYNDKVKSLYEKWWAKIKTSRDIEANKQELNDYRASLKPGDVTLLGCLTEGGQGLATANNGKYIAVRSTTKWADNARKSRPIKLADAIRKYNIVIPGMNNYKNERDYLNSLSEKNIAELFDSLKEKYGRDIFGQGYLYKIIEDSELADVDSLTEDEKENGIEPNKKFYVPYDKGDKDGNRWYLETPFAIAWSKENVQFLKTNSGKKGEGMPVV
ncbi:MAG: BREX-1 system adenine-specific DNA-methyltransferase PglX, partial [Prevotella sp.]|nr:BREX-1 system adenine-specific DNA-methyltransferase PglX [Prevotella sp.]